ncbi:MAG: lytic transglycosylase domain-containing protein [Candidatus Puniceispirillum sp.]|nr:lytic transglycosylase domain-containing protein [Candidatus Puniceispirillum sp.]MBT6416593.1 lytic transglycosylase domain-containing protein [Candidatus Puniceispirillum sp.]
MNAFFKTSVFCRLNALNYVSWCFFRRCLVMLAVLTVMSGQSVNAAPLPAPLPTPLSDFDAVLYERLFALQQAGKMKQATREMGRLRDPMLMGHLLSQRYLHPTAWRSTYSELASWLRQYNDHPDASRIYWLAKRRKGNAQKAPTKPKSGYLNGYGQAGSYGYRPTIPMSTKARASISTTRNIARKVRRSIRKGWPTGAVEILSSKANKRYLTKQEEAQLRGEVAHAYFIFGYDDKAIRQARYAIGVGRESATMAYWAAGLASWRSGHYEDAGLFFRTLAGFDKVSPGLRSSAAFWAHRVDMRHGRYQNATKYLEIAARELDSFYGVIARNALGQSMDISFDLPPEHPDFMAWLTNQLGGQRVLALLQIGRPHDAARELRYLWMDMPDQFKPSVMRLAALHNMPGLSFRVGEIIRKNGGKSWYGALYPHPEFADIDFTVDEALVWAVSRQESGFNPRAKSSAKASGLMQLMPRTAAFIGRDRGYRDRKRSELLLPKVNLALGQKYIRHLLDEQIIDNSLVRLLAAYNGGPGNLNKWLRQVNHQDDVFLLVESMPARETRYYVKNVVSNLAIYRARFGEDSPALLSLAIGEKGTYVPFAATN